MTFLDIKDPAERATLVKEYVTAMKTVKQHNMANRELKEASKSADTTFGIYMREDGQLAMRNKIVEVNRNKNTLSVDDTV